MATRQSLREDPRSSNQGLIGCQSNLIPSSCAASWYDIAGTSIRSGQRALARRRRVGSGYFSSARMSQILQSVLISVLWTEVFAIYQTLLWIQGIGKHIKVLVKLSRRVSLFFLSSIKCCGNSCQEHRKLWLFRLMSHNFVSVTCKRVKRFNMTFQWHEGLKALCILIFIHKDFSSPGKRVIVVSVSHVTGRSWSWGTCWENWTCGTSRA